jgi:hypothetical protein
MGEVEESIQIQAVEGSGTCTFNRTQFVAGRAGLTTSTTFVPVPFASTTVRPTVTSCLRITFSAEAFTSAVDNLMFVEARVDGSSVGVFPTTDKQFVTSSGPFADYHTVVQTKVSVPPGVHTVTMFFRSLDGTNVAINEFHLAVDYNAP